MYITINSLFYLFFFFFGWFRELDVGDLFSQWLPSKAMDSLNSLKSHWLTLVILVEVILVNIWKYLSQRSPSMNGFSSVCNEHRASNVLYKKNLSVIKKVVHVFSFFKRCPSISYTSYSQTFLYHYTHFDYSYGCNYLYTYFDFSYMCNKATVPDGGGCNCLRGQRVLSRPFELFQGDGPALVTTGAGNAAFSG